MTTASRALLIAGLTLAWGCTVYDPDLIAEGSATLPARPASSTSSDVDAVEATFALYSVSLDQTGARWMRLGLDLDGVDTASIDDAAECLAANGRPQLDGEKGIDNSFGQHVLPALVSLIACMEDDIALNQGRGLGTLLLGIRGWNGTSNDAAVEVSLWTSVDGTSETDVSEPRWGGTEGVSLLASKGAPRDAADPAWDGEDTFFVDPKSVEQDDLDHPKVRAIDAYVSKGRIVLPIDASNPLVFPTGPGSLSLAIDGFLIADLSEDGQSLAKGLIAGRATADSLAATLKPLGICEESFQESIVALLTDNLDLRGANETPSPGDPCTSMGVSFTFEGMPAKMGEVAAPGTLPIPDPCVVAPTEGLQPAFDRCCRSVEVNAADLLPDECSALELAVYESSPTPIPVPATDGF
ncbi:MAG: hypothetical protein WBG86_02815 [Polyangiales bacterium]